MLLESKSKFNISSATRNNDSFDCQTPKKALTARGASAWSNNNMYRTSYKDMVSKSPVENKNSAIPGYQGHVPFVKAENEIGQRFTKTSRKGFEQSKLDQNLQTSQSFFNISRQQFHQDHTLLSTSHKYGKQTIQDPHPNHNIQNGDNLSTTFRESYKNPRFRSKPNFRSLKNFFQNMDQLSYQQQNIISSQEHAKKETLKQEYSKYLKFLQNINSTTNQTQEGGQTISQSTSSSYFNKYQQAQPNQTYNRSVSAFNLNKTKQQQDTFNKFQLQNEANQSQLPTFDMLTKDQQKGMGMETQSGYFKSILNFDGSSWVPKTNMHPKDLRKTEYRDRFNQEKPFHKMTLKQSHHQLPRKVLVYDKEQ